MGRCDGQRNPGSLPGLTREPVRETSFPIIFAESVVISAKYPLPRRASFPTIAPPVNAPVFDFQPEGLGLG